MIRQKLILILVIGGCAAALLPSASLANQMGPGKAEQINALGLSVDYMRTRDRNDAGLNASYRYGSMWLLSLFFSADAGYRFIDRSVNVRAGGQAMFLFIGLEAGLLCSYRTVRECTEWYEHKKIPGPCAPGAYVGLAGVIPVKPMAIFLSAGGNFYFINHDHEFYIKAACLVNFSAL
jgi:hypothetical protein